MPQDSQRPPHSHSAAGARYMAGSAFVFSLMSLAVKLGGLRLPSQEIIFVRAVISLCLSFALLRRARISVWGTRRRLLLLRGLLGFGGLSCFFYAITKLPLAEVTVLQYLHPVFTAVLAALLLGESVSNKLAFSLGLCCAGVLLVAKPLALFGTSPRLELLPFLAALGGGAFSAGAYTVVRKLSHTEHPLVIVFYFPLVALPASAPFLAHDALWPTGFEWLVLIAVGITAQIGQVWLTRGLKLETAGRATAFSYLQVLFATGWGMLFFDEWPDVWAGLGALLILGGTLLLVLRR